MEFVSSKTRLSLAMLAESTLESTYVMLVMHVEMTPGAGF